LTKTFNNAGQFIKAMPASITTVQNNTIAFINGGSVDVQAGTLKFINETLSGNGTYDVGSGATLDFGTTTAPGDITGAGTVMFSSGTIAVNNVYNITGSTQFRGATVDFGPAALQSLGSPNVIDITSGTANFISGTPLVVTAYDQTGGVVTGTDDITVNTNPVNWSGGQMNGSGITTANGGMNIGGQIRLGRRFDLPAGQTASWTAGNIYLQDDGTDVGVFNNFGTFRAEHAGNQVIALWIGNLTKTFNNAGQFIKAMPASITTVQNNTIAFINGGSVDVQAGTLRFINETLSGNGTYDVGSGATLDFGITTALDGTITGLGTVVFSSGTIDITGILNIQGSYQQTSARLGIVLYGSGGVAGVDFDQLNVTGNAALGGILDVSLDTGFTPSVGDSFVVMTYGSQSGAYTSIFTPSGFNWNVSVGLNDITLTVVP
jgi:hypothetical protein